MRAITVEKFAERIRTELAGHSFDSVHFFGRQDDEGAVMMAAPDSDAAFALPFLAIIALLKKCVGEGDVEGVANISMRTEVLLEAVAFSCATVSALESIRQVRAERLQNDKPKAKTKKETLDSLDLAAKIIKFPAEGRNGKA